jgi:hypothetical protein
MSTLNLLGDLGSFVLGCVVVYVFKPFLGSYSAKKGENLATKEDIAQITKVQEEIKAAISDGVWDRQEQWKLRRDAVLDAIRALHGLQDALNGLDSLFSVPAERCDQAAQEHQTILQHEAALRFRDKSTTYEQAMFVVDLVIGGQLSKELSNFFQIACPLAVRMFKDQQRAFAKPETKKELAKSETAVIHSARVTLGIEGDGGLHSAMKQTDH